MRKFIAAIALGASCIAVQAQVVVPNVSTNTIGGTWYAPFPAAGTNSLTYRMTMDAGQLTALVGQDITSVQFRYSILPGLGMPGSWPATNIVIPNFSISMGSAISPAIGSTALFNGTPTSVRTGSLSIAANSYVAVDPFNPTNWIPAITFDTPFHYTGGDLGIEYVVSPLPVGTPQITFDAILGNQGYGTDFRAWSSGGSGGGAAAFVTKFNAVPEPMSLVVLGFGALALVRRRKS